MNAFQIFWSEPFNKGKKEINFKDYYLLTMILSVIQWKKNHQHPIKLYTDEKVIRYLKKYDLLDLWDDYDTDTFKKINKNIDLNCFWSVGKFYAYLNEKAPCIAIDVDMILWNNIDYFIDNIKVGFSHWEDTKKSSYYVEMKDLSTPPNYIFNNKWNWNNYAANTSIVYFADDEIKNYYANEVIKFIINNKINPKENYEKELLFIEQRLLVMLAEEKGLINETKPLIDLIWHPEEGEFYDSDGKKCKWDFSNIDNNDIATHLWVEKRWIEADKNRREICCKRLMKLIAEIDINIVKKLEKIKCVNKYSLEYI